MSISVFPIPTEHLTSPSLPIIIHRAASIDVRPLLLAMVFARLRRTGQWSGGENRRIPTIDPIIGLERTADSPVLCVKDEAQSRPMCLVLQ